MMKVRYKGDIDQFPLEIENWKVKARVTGVAFRKMIDDQIPDEAVRRMSMIDPIADDREWLEAVRTASKTEEDFIEGRKLRREIPQDQPQVGNENETNLRRQW